MPPFLVLDRLAKSFGAGRVLHDLSLEVGAGEVIALLGPSGSGKTTALRLIAGFEAPDAGGGRIRVGGEDVTGLPPARRHFGMVFQHYALFPHLSVGENVAFGLAGRKLDREAMRTRVAAALALVDLPGYEKRRVGEISGGQQQRVALARALAPEPRVLLLDEPLSNLDPALRERTRRELKRAVRRVGITTVIVTHEQEEAFYLGDRVAVLEGGKLHQVGTPEELYERPASRFVATFIGRASALPGRVETVAGDGTAVKVALAPGVAWDGVAVAALGSLAPADAVDLVVRPESLAFVPEGTPGALRGTVVERRYAGPVSFFTVALDRPGGPSGVSTPPETGVEGESREVEVLADSSVARSGTVAVAPLPVALGRPAPRVFSRDSAGPAGLAKAGRT